VSRHPLDPHGSAPVELRDRLAAERGGNPFLVYRDGDERQVIVELEAGRDRLAIGRRATSDVALNWDPEVSRVHAALERIGSDWVVCDDGLSHNGTWVNGERVNGRRPLRGGDVVAVGETLIAFCAPGGGSGAGATRTALQARARVTVTAAQRRVLVALCRPLAEGPYAAPAPNREIADELFLSVDTVKGTLSRLFESFDLEDVPQNQKRAALARRALEAGVVNRGEL
jgi:pSer/pThr/pTyr-binding forkhead associated (FHA) protein